MGREGDDVVRRQRAVLDLRQEGVEVLALLPQQRVLEVGDDLLRPRCALKLGQLHHRSAEEPRVDLVAEAPARDRSTNSDRVRLGR